MLWIVVAILLMMTLVPIAVTLWIRSAWLMPWLMLLGAACVWLWRSLATADGPGGFFAYMFVSIFIQWNGVAALVRFLAGKRGTP